MAKKTGIPIKKAKLSNKRIKADFQKIFVALSKSAVMLFAGNPVGTIKELVGALGGFKFATDSSDLAYELILTALTNSAQSLAEENRLNFTTELTDPEQLEGHKEYEQFRDGITKIVEDEEIVLEYEMLKNPRTIPLLPEFQQFFKDYLILFGIPEMEAELVKNRLPSYFIFELNDEWRNNYSKYEPLIEKLDAPTSEAARKERQWEAYYTYLEREAQTPVFNESFSLNDIFIPLRAYHNKKEKNEDGREEFNKEAVWLEESMNHWLNSSNRDNAIKVIEGGPGSGKSSFVKWWTAKIANSRSCTVLFFPLHHFNYKTGIKEGVGEYFRNDIDIPIDFNPLEELTSNSNVLLVFDGLDELVVRDKSSKEGAGSFIQELKNYCGLINNSKQRIKALITGRPIAIQNNENKLRGSDNQVLYLLPYYLGKSDREQYNDASNILEEDQRHQWWNRFYRYKGLAYQNLPKELRNENMDKITAEPLLNYLVALSWKEAPEKFDKNTNINDVYYQLITGVYNRDYEKKRPNTSLGDVELDDFILILEQIAICAWQGGDARVTTERKIEQHIKGSDMEDLLEEYKSSTKSGVSRLLTAFYFRKFGKEDTESRDDTFEFTHKSFGEYLVARSFVELIKETHEQRNENKDRSGSRRSGKRGWTIEQTLGEWLRVAGHHILDHDIMDFIVNELKTREAKEPIKDWQKTLCEVISRLVVTGMPIHLRPERTNILEETRFARNAEEALVAALSACATVTDELSVINLGENKSQIGVWLHRVSTSIHYPDLAFQCLNKLDLGGVNLRSMKLFLANLSGTNLSSADLFQAYLRLVDLSGANLIGANLGRTDLGGANLIGANLEGTDLRRANLIGADLRNANLSGADLRNANLLEADLRGADNISFKQLLQVKSLYQTKGIAPKIFEQIKKEKPELLENPYQ